MRKKINSSKDSLSVSKEKVEQIEKKEKNVGQNRTFGSNLRKIKK